MNKQELMTNVNEILDKHLGNTIFTDPVLSITKSAKDNRILMGLEFEQGGIVLEKELFKLKDVIARIKDFDSGTQIVWLDAILNELGSDYGILKYKTGYEQGRFEGEYVGQQLKDADKVRQELNKPVVKQFVADWYEEHKEELEFNIWDWIKYTQEEEKIKNRQFTEWLAECENDPVETLIKMKLFGYEVEKDKRYTVKMRTTNQPLFYNSLEKKLFFSLGELATQFTFKQLEEAGFGEVFNSPLFEVEEVEDE